MNNLKFRVWDNHDQNYSELPFWKLLLTKDGRIYNTEDDTYSNQGEQYQQCAHGVVQKRLCHSLQ